MALFASAEDFLEKASPGPSESELSKRPKIQEELQSETAWMSY